MHTMPEHQSKKNHLSRQSQTCGWWWGIPLCATRWMRRKITIHLRLKNWSGRTRVLLFFILIRFRKIINPFMRFEHAEFATGYLFQVA